MISRGDWLLVKDRLNHGEQQDAFARRYVTNALGGHSVNLRAQGMEKVTAYLLEWNLTGPDDTHVLPLRNVAGELDPIVMAASLNAIDPESFAEIFNAIEGHETAMAAARAEEKKLQAGESASSATSPSPAPVPGPSETSAT
jgi:hypothetical protein